MSKPLIHWSAKEVQLLRENYGKVRVCELVILIGRSHGSIHWKASELKLRSPNKAKLSSRAWTNEQRQILIDGYEKIPTKQLARVLGKGVQTVYSNAWKMGLCGIKVTAGEYVPARVTIPQEIIDRYLAGTPACTLFQELGVSDHLFRKAMKRQGIPIRSRLEVNQLTVGRLQAGCKKARQDPDWKRRMSATLQGIPLEEWTGFKNPEYAALRYKPEWKAWRVGVFRRDLHTCVMCKRAWPKILDPHHIVRKSKRPDLMYDLDNGVALCRRCHISIANHEEDWAPVFHEHVQMKKTLAYVQTEFVVQELKG